MRPEFWHYRRSGESFQASRPVFALPTNDWGMIPEAQPAQSDVRPRHDLGKFLEDPDQAERLPDPVLPTVFSQLWRKANAAYFEQQDAECAAYQTETFGILPTDATPLVFDPAEDSLSLEQGRFVSDLYSQQAGSAEQPVAKRLAAVPVAEQVAAIKNLAVAGGIPCNDQELIDLSAALDHGATIVADMGSGVPLVCGASPTVNPQSEVYVLSTAGSGLLPPPEGRDADHADPPAKHGGIVASSVATDASADGQAGTYHGRASNTLVGAMDDTVVKTHSVTLARFVPADPGRTIDYREAAQVALLPPRHAPTSAKSTDDPGTRDASDHYTDAERQLIMGLSRDPQVAASLAPLAGNSRDIAGARDLLALRLGKGAMEPLADDDNLKRSTNLFHAIKEALEKNPDLKEIAAARFRQQLATMRPRNTEEEPLTHHLSELDIMACLDDAEVMLDLVSAHTHHELPLYAFAKLNLMPEGEPESAKGGEPKLEIA